MTSITSADRERQRFEHLVLGRPRPRTAPSHRMRRAMPAALAPGIEERVALRERWSHKTNGTAETHEHVAAANERPGSLLRLWNSGAIDDDQKAAAEQIEAVYWLVVRDVTVRTASLETRTDGGRHGRAEEERLGAIVADRAYTDWRQALGAHAELLLAVIVHDASLTRAARRHGVGMAKARRLLTEALDRWWTMRAAARREAQRAREIAPAI